MSRLSSVLVLAALLASGCAQRVDRSFDTEPDSAADVVADAGPAAEPEAGKCVCEVEWVRIVTPGQFPIRCTPRPDCPPDAACVPVLPLTEDPACRLAP